MKKVPFLFLVILSIFCALTTKSQVLIDDFENGLDDWHFYYTVYPDYYGFEEISSNNIHSEVSTNNYHSENNSLFLYPNYFQGAVRSIKKDEKFHMGTYTAWFYINPNSYNSTDGHFYFQYQDDSTFYLVKLYPQYSDNPGVSLTVSDNGDVTMIEKNETNQSGVIFSEWVKLIVERHDDFRVVVKIFNPQTNTEYELLDLYDETIVKEGYVGVGSYSNSVYWDDIGYENPMVNIEQPQIEAYQPSVYPNPANNMITIENAGRNFNYTIYDMQGRKILMGNNTETNVISLQSVGIGLYIIEITNGNYCHKQKITVQ
jgi:hypothetical protein